MPSISSCSSRYGSIESLIDYEYIEGLRPDDLHHSVDQDHYAVLGLGNYRCRATPLQIKEAYRKKVLRYHPDKNSSANPDSHFFICINKAWQVLGNTKLRRAYDFTDQHATLEQKKFSGKYKPDAVEDFFARSFKFWCNCKWCRKSEGQDVVRDRSKGRKTCPSRFLETDILDIYLLDCCTFKGQTYSELELASMEKMAEIAKRDREQEKKNLLDSLRGNGGKDVSTEVTNVSKRCHGNRRKTSAHREGSESRWRRQLEKEISGTKTMSEKVNVGGIAKNVDAQFAKVAREKLKRMRLEERKKAEEAEDKALQLRWEIMENERLLAEKFRTKAETEQGKSICSSINAPASDVKDTQPEANATDLEIQARMEAFKAHQAKVIKEQRDYELQIEREKKQEKRLARELLNRGREMRDMKSKHDHEVKIGTHKVNSKGNTEIEHQPGHPGNGERETTTSTMLTEQIAKDSAVDKERIESNTREFNTFQQKQTEEKRASKMQEQRDRKKSRRLAHELLIRGRKMGEDKAMIPKEETVGNGTAVKETIATGFGDDLSVGNVQVGHRNRCAEDRSPSRADKNLEEFNALQMKQIKEKRATKVQDRKEKSRRLEFKILNHAKKMERVESMPCIEEHDYTVKQIQQVASDNTTYNAGGDGNNDRPQQTVANARVSTETKDQAYGANQVDANTSDTSVGLHTISTTGQNVEEITKTLTRKTKHRSRMAHQFSEHFTNAPGSISKEVIPTSVFHSDKDENGSLIHPESNAQCASQLMNTIINGVIRKTIKNMGRNSCQKAEACTYNEAIGDCETEDFGNMVNRSIGKNTRTQVSYCAQEHAMEQCIGPEPQKLVSSTHGQARNEEIKSCFQMLEQQLSCNAKNTDCNTTKRTKTLNSEEDICNKNVIIHSETSASKSNDDSTDIKITVTDTDLEKRRNMKEEMLQDISERINNIEKKRIERERRFMKMETRSMTTCTQKKEEFKYDDNSKKDYSKKSTRAFPVATSVGVSPTKRNTIVDKADDELDNKMSAMQLKWRAMVDESNKLDSCLRKMKSSQSSSGAPLGKIVEMKSEESNTSELLCLEAQQKRISELQDMLKDTVGKANKWENELKKYEELAKRCSVNVIESQARTSKIQNKIDNTKSTVPSNSSEINLILGDTKIVTIPANRLLCDDECHPIPHLDLSKKTDAVNVTNFEGIRPETANLSTDQPDSSKYIPANTGIKEVLLDGKSETAQQAALKGTKNLAAVTDVQRRARNLELYNSLISVDDTDSTEIWEDETTSESKVKGTNYIPPVDVKLDDKKIIRIESHCNMDQGCFNNLQENCTVNLKIDPVRSNVENVSCDADENNESLENHQGTIENICAESESTLDLERVERNVPEMTRIDERQNTKVAVNSPLKDEDSAIYDTFKNKIKSRLIAERASNTVLRDKAANEIDKLRDRERQLQTLFNESERDVGSDSKVNASKPHVNTMDKLQEQKSIGITSCQTDSPCITNVKSEVTAECLMDSGSNQDLAHLHGNSDVHDAKKNDTNTVLNLNIMKKSPVQSSADISNCETESHRTRNLDMENEPENTHFVSLPYEGGQSTSLDGSDVKNSKVDQTKTYFDTKLVNQLAVFTLDDKSRNAEALRQQNTLQVGIEEAAPENGHVALENIDSFDTKIQRNLVESHESSCTSIQMTEMEIESNRLSEEMSRPPSQCDSDEKEAKCHPQQLSESSIKKTEKLFSNIQDMLSTLERKKVPLVRSGSSIEKLAKGYMEKIDLEQRRVNSAQIQLKEEGLTTCYSDKEKIFALHVYLKKKNGSRQDGDESAYDPENGSEPGDLAQGKETKLNISLSEEKRYWHFLTTIFLNYMQKSSVEEEVSYYKKCILRKKRARGRSLNDHGDQSDRTDNLNDEYDTTSHICPIPAKRTLVKNIPLRQGHGDVSKKENDELGGLCETLIRFNTKNQRGVSYDSLLERKLLDNLTTMDVCAWRADEERLFDKALKENVPVPGVWRTIAALIPGRNKYDCLFHFAERMLLFGEIRKDALEKCVLAETEKI